MPSSKSYSKPSSSVARSKSDTSLMRDKNGCITCRVRQKKCNGIAPGDEACGDCLRLNIQCLGVQHNRPDWLRNAEALKETKYRIKHHLTEYPVPRGRGPAPVRPFLEFNDLIQKYSPPRFATSGPSSPSFSSDQLYRMEPDSPPAYSTLSQSNNYLSVQTGYYASQGLPSPNTPSPSMPHTPMPLTPSSSQGSLFATPEIPCSFSTGIYTGEFMSQAGTTYHETAYIPEMPGYGNINPPSRTPYRHQHSELLFLNSTMNPQQFNYEFQDFTSPSARRHH